MSSPRIGIFGGTFNPVHQAHLIIAEQAQEILQSEKILFIPAAAPPHKNGQPLASFEHRTAMLRLAVKNNPRFEISEIENHLPQPSYTVQTLRHLQTLYPAHDFDLIMGADSLLNFHTWKSPQELLKLCRIAVYPRPGFDPETIDAPLRAQAMILSVPMIEISSTQIRDRVSRGQSVRYLLPDSVRDYICEHRIYLNERI